MCILRLFGLIFSPFIPPYTKLLLAQISWLRNQDHHLLLILSWSFELADQKCLLCIYLLHSKEYHYCKMCPFPAHTQNVSLRFSIMCKYKVTKTYNGKQKELQQTKIDKKTNATQNNKKCQRYEPIRIHCNFQSSSSCFLKVNSIIRC